jgi:hypothetical protein
MNNAIETMTKISRARGPRPAPGSDSLAPGAAVMSLVRT